MFPIISHFENVNQNHRKILPRSFKKKKINCWHDVEKNRILMHFWWKGQLV